MTKDSDFVSWLKNRGLLLLWAGQRLYIVLKVDMLPDRETVGTLFGKPVHNHVGRHVGG